MKKITLILSILLWSFPAFTQNVLNGGFEEVFINTDNPDYSRPLDWLSLSLTPSPEGFPNVPRGVLTTESRSGNYAIKMQPIICWSSTLSGGFFTGNTGVDSPYAFAHAYSERPAYFNFYYMFHQEGNDSAYAELTLFDYDTSPGVPTPERMDTIGFCNSYISTETNEYTLLSLPISYFSDSIPDFMRIRFRSGRYSNQSIGTTLWVDDVSVSGGTVGIAYTDAEQADISLYPNPFFTQLRIGVKPSIKVETVLIFDTYGRQLKRWDRFQSSFDIADLSSGIYFVQVQTNKGSVSKKVIKQ